MSTRQLALTRSLATPQVAAISQSALEHFLTVQPVFSTRRLATQLYFPIQGQPTRRAVRRLFLATPPAAAILLWVVVHSMEILLVALTRPWAQMLAAALPQPIT